MRYEIHGRSGTGAPVPVPATEPRALHDRVRPAAPTPKAGPTTGASSPPARPPWKPTWCLKWQLSDVVYRQLLTDAAGANGKQTPGPGGHRGATMTSSAADLNPHDGTSDQPAGPATLRRAQAASTPDAASIAVLKGRRAPRCQREGLRPTNDVDPDQRRPTLTRARPRPSTTTTGAPVEGSHVRTSRLTESMLR